MPIERPIRQRLAGIGIAPPLLGLAGLATAGLINYAAPIQLVRLHLGQVVLLVAPVGICWLSSARRMRRAVLAEAQKFRTLLDAAPEAIVGVSDDGSVRFANARVSEIFGYTAAELVGAPIELLIPERYRVSHVASRSRYLDQPRVRPMGSGLSLLAKRKDGTEVPVEVSLSRIDTQQEPLVLCIVRDVTEQARTRQALLEANEELKASLSEVERRAEELTQLTGMGELLQCCVSEQEVHSMLANSVTRLFPRTHGGLYLLNASRNLVELTSTWGSDRSQLPTTFQPHECWGLRRGRAHHSGAAPNLASCCTHDRREHGLDIICIPMTAQGETIGLLHTRFDLGDEGARHANMQVLRAIAEQGAFAIANLRLREALRLKSIRDPLTGLYNRRFLEEWLEREISRSGRAACSLGVLMLDLDHFKSFNDTFGHQSGDLALREVCGLLQRSVRGSDVVCRFGGEEISILLPDTDLATAAEIAEKLRIQIGQLSIHRNGQPLGSLHASIGVASFPQHGRTPEDILHAADVALYTAKSGGRNRVCIVSAEAPARRA